MENKLNGEDLKKQIFREIDVALANTILQIIDENSLDYGFVVECVIQGLITCLFDIDPILTKEICVKLAFKKEME